jgi:membrane protease YdiL (CAAX protease family)
MSLSNESPDLSAGRSASRARSIALWAAIWACVGAFVLLQHPPGEPESRKPGANGASSDLGAPGFQFTYVSRYALGVRDLARRAGPDSSPFSPAQFLGLLEKSAVNPADSVALVMITAELAGRELADSRLRELASSSALTDTRKSDLLILRDYYRGEAPDSLALSGFARRYGWFGQLLSQDSAREGAFASARRVALVVIGAVTATGFAGIAGAAALIVIGILFRSGKLGWAGRFEPGGHETAFLESAALALVTALLIMALAHRIAPMIAWVSYPLLFLPLFWPLLRGVAGRDYREAIGLTRGRGLVREVVLGLTGYLAAFPVLAAGLIVTLAILKGDPARVMHPITEGLQRSGSGQLALLFLLGVVVGPLFEEMLFRGVMQHHLRRRSGRVVAGTIASVIFALLHPQGLAVAPMLALIGFVLSLIREWRGTLAASYAAHAANNGAVFVFTLLIFR